MPKERNYNPVQAQRKADKAKAVKKGKAEVQVRRNEKLARKNPDRIQKHIDDIKATKTDGDKLTRHEQQVLDGLEKELKIVKRARDALGDNAPTFDRDSSRKWQGGSNSIVGKRRRGSATSSSDGDIPDDVRAIPMPRDTPPPIPKKQMDKWFAKRRAKADTADFARRRQTEGEHVQKLSAEEKPAEAKTVYEAAPIVRDLRKEAVSAFMPSIVQRKLGKVKGQGGLIEPEEAELLEREGYLKTSNVDVVTMQQGKTGKAATVEDSDDVEL